MRPSKSQHRYSAEPMLEDQASLTPEMLKDVKKFMDDEYGIGSKTAIQTIQDQDEKRNSLATQSVTVSQSRFK